jgi:PAS domain S-box-containing protein
VNWPRRFRSVRHKLLAGVLLTSIAALLVNGVALLFYDLRSYREAGVKDLTTQAELIGHATSAALQFDDPQFAARSLALLRVRPAVRAAALYNSRGTIFARYFRADSTAHVLPRLPEADSVAIDGDRMTVFRRIVDNDEIVGTVYIAADFEIYARLASYAVIAGSVMLIALLVALLLSAWLQAAITRPIIRVANLARQVVEQRDYSVRATKSTDDEISVLVDAFNDMLSEIEQRTRALERSNTQLEREAAERSEAEQALRTSEERYRSLVSVSAQIVWTTDAGGQVVEPQPAWQAYTGQAAGDLTSLPGGSDAIHPDEWDHARELWRHAIETGTPFATEVRLRRSDGVYRWFAARGVPVRRADGSVKEWVGTCTDIDERKIAAEEVQRLTEELEQRVRQRTAQLEDKNRELEAFSYSVSHDLRAPLRAIDGFGQALVEDFGGQLDDEARRYLSRIRSATQRMSQLIDDLLTLSRISRVELSWTEVDLSAMARQIIDELMHREAERTVEVSVWDGIMVQGDPRLLRIALENMLGNAWKFTAKTGAPRIEFGALEDREKSTYFVRDNGAGFDMAHADNLFGAFQRLHAVTDFPGTGIGLATVQRIVHRHGGRIWVNAQRGRGATFFFTLGRGEGLAREPDTAGRSASAAS